MRERENERLERPFSSIVPPLLPAIWIVAFLSLVVCSSNKWLSLSLSIYLSICLSILAAFNQTNFWQMSQSLRITATFDCAAFLPFFLLLSSLDSGSLPAIKKNINFYDFSVEQSTLDSINSVLETTVNIERVELHNRLIHSERDVTD